MTAIITYTDYIIEDTVQKDSNVYSAYKANAAEIGKLTFSHSFYFQSCVKDKANCTINGAPAKAYNPGFDNNYYQCNLPGVSIYSLNLEDFYIQDCTLGYFDRRLLTKEEFDNL